MSLRLSHSLLDMLGLNYREPCYCILYRAVKYIKAQQPVGGVCTGWHSPDTWTNFVIGCGNACLHLRKITTWRFTRMGTYCIWIKISFFFSWVAGIHDLDQTPEYISLPSSKCFKGKCLRKPWALCQQGAPEVNFPFLLSQEAWSRYSDHLPLLNQALLPGKLCVCSILGGTSSFRWVDGSFSTHSAVCHCPGQYGLL